MNPEDLQALFLDRKIDEKYLIEAALAEHFRRQKIDAVRGRRDEQPA